MIVNEISLVIQNRKYWNTGFYSFLFLISLLSFFFFFVTSRGRGEEEGVREEIINQLMKSSRVHGWVYRQKRRSWTRWLMIDYFEHLFIWAWRLFLEKPSKGNVGSFETRGVFRVWFASQCATFLKVGINLRVLGQEPIKELRQAPSLLFSPSSPPSSP